MLERSAKRIPGWSLALTLATLPSMTWAAESLPASVRACTAETDSLRRLMCFDREVARFPEPKAAAPQTNRSPPPAAASAASSPSPPPASSGAAAPASAASKTDSANKAGHIAARVVSIDHSPNEMVLHLDNGQAWQQTQGVAGDLSLKVGDSVTIDKHLGSYYLNGPHVSGMKVRQN